MKPSVTRFLLGVLIVMALSFAAALPLTSDAGAGARAGAAAGIAAGALSAAVSFFPVRRALSANDVRFMRAFLVGFVLRFLFLGLVGLSVHYLVSWSFHHYLVAVGLSYPFYMMLEGWALSRQVPGRRATAANGAGDEHRVKE